MKYFNDCTNLNDLKKAYKAAAKKYHPDCGGSTEIMQEVNNEYEEAFEVLKAQQNAAAAADETGYTRATTESAGDFIKIITSLLDMEGVEVELCGRWLWISGNTKDHKEALKAAGCRWCSKKKLWSWHFHEEGEKHSRKTKSMEDIRAKYGSQKFGKGSSKLRLED